MIIYFEGEKVVMKHPPTVCVESGNTNKSHIRCESPAVIITLLAMRGRK